MSEQLFKLKKGGEFVGYECVSEGETPDTEEKCLNWVYGKDEESWSLEPILHDEKCPFVTTDKNGDKVFAGDKVKWILPDYTSAPGQEEELDAVVVGGFEVFDVEGIDFVEASKFKDIELIKESHDK